MGTASVGVAQFPWTRTVPCSIAPGPQRDTGVVRARGVPSAAAVVALVSSGVGFLPVFTGEPTEPSRGSSRRNSVCGR